MSLLYLVRHGQASFFGDNYDRLSPLGERQARRLGEFFAARRVQFDAVFSGPAERQRRTTEIVIETMAAAGLPSPTPTIVAGLNEHGGDKLLSKPHMHAVLEKFPELGGLEQAFREAREPEDVQKSFQKLFEAAVLLWTRGEINPPGMELWDEFHARARKAFESITSHGERGRTTLAVSSVGPISVAVQMALQTSIPVSLDLGWRLRNASVTTFIYTPGRFNLDSFNSLAHLADPAEITYR
ncbi:MAG TPA: histidine phosphatase family protein [Planctomycetaceae bacterium]|nr:histidine phosphatase family protein [Planctomycetaceae bacterium]